MLGEICELFYTPLNQLFYIIFFKDLKSHRKIPPIHWPMHSLVLISFLEKEYQIYLQLECFENHFYKRKNLAEHLKGHFWHKGSFWSYFHFQRNIMNFTHKCLLSLGCCNKTPWTSSLHNRYFFLTVHEAWCPRSRCWQIWSWWEPFFWLANNRLTSLSLTEGESFAFFCFL